MRAYRLRRSWALAFALLVPLAGCADQAPEESPSENPSTANPSTTGSGTTSEEPTATATPGSADISVIASGLDAPWSIAFYQDAALVSERDSARVLELDKAGSAREVGIIDGVTSAGEGGLLGLATHGNYLYAYSTTASGNRIQRFKLTGKPGSLGLGEAETILSGIPASSVHNGGRLAFGPDGMLYATTGDATDGENSQSLDSLGGKILRMTPTGEVPTDNPFEGSLVYSYGHRNVQGIAWGPDGKMYASEFGQDTWDELNVIEPGGNYGWPVVEGAAGNDDYVDPVQQWRTADASPSGIAIADGSIYMANLRGERLRVVPLDDLDEASERYNGEFGRLRTATVTPSGQLWLVTNNTDGRGDPGPQDDRIVQIPLD